jgi:hypothetical protein
VEMDHEPPDRVVGRVHARYISDCPPAGITRARTADLGAGAVMCAAVLVDPRWGAVVSDDCWRDEHASALRSELPAC